ncbi:hypothetical protein ONS95_006746 [Cadophora gregata]|uniref:uncharacterized protein n=1 Tax=Cadophora gregata TaxID=51156 RepID=UPI0026DAEC0B|nr:uncharacterized protein ONS95_006746 [Cadophora gregata]KAK0101582.1 hypothetical protein ONS95_006746 [Cadophora gregata]KAK0106405.1 hypothetical protein ONS96_004036 [Cadophora gregata f. sp. sojae]
MNVVQNPVDAIEDYTPFRSIQLPASLILGAALNALGMSLICSFVIQRIKIQGKQTKRGGTTTELRIFRSDDANKTPNLKAWGTILLRERKIGRRVDNLEPRIDNLEPRLAAVEHELQEHVELEAPEYKQETNLDWHDDSGKLKSVKRSGSADELNVAEKFNRYSDDNMHSNPKTLCTTARRSKYLKMQISAIKRRKQDTIKETESGDEKVTRYEIKSAGLLRCSVQDAWLTWGFRVVFTDMGPLFFASFLTNILW